MRSAVADALEAAAGPGWRLIPVGGGARDIRSHDCDFVVTHDSNKCGLELVMAHPQGQPPTRTVPQLLRLSRSEQLCHSLLCSACKR